jgi:hypothetical protein
MPVRDHYRRSNPLKESQIDGSDTEVLIDVLGVVPKDKTVFKRRKIDQKSNESKEKGQENKDTPAPGKAASDRRL